MRRNAAILPLCLALTATTLTACNNADTASETTEPYTVGDVTIKEATEPTTIEPTDLQDVLAQREFERQDQHLLNLQEAGATADQLYATARAYEINNAEHRSKTWIYRQLLDEHYLEKDAQYAVDTVEVNWKENALLWAEYYRDEEGWDHPAAVFAILANDRGDAFTDEEADYALDMLDWPRR